MLGDLLFANNSAAAVAAIGVIFLVVMLLVGVLDSNKLIFGFNSIIFADLIPAFGSSVILDFLFVLKITIDLADDFNCLECIDDGFVVVIVVSCSHADDGVSESDDECDENSFNFEEEVNSKLPVAVLALLKLRVLLPLVDETFCDHVPIFFYFKSSSLLKLKL